MGGEMPPMETPMDAPMGDNVTPEDGAMPPADEGMPSSFDTNFDAGVNADEETDPKKFIQQLTGKLSQSLNSYNNEQEEPDTELGKFVLGMVIKQATKGMDEKDRKGIIKKLNTSNTGEDAEAPEGDMLDDNMPDEDGAEPQNDEMMDGNKPQMESKSFNFTKKQIFENFGIAMDNDACQVKTSDTNITPDVTNSRRSLPFKAPSKFKK